MRPLVRSDLEAVLAIEAASNPSPWGEGHFLPFVRPAGGPLADAPAARKRGEAVNMAWVYAEGGEGAEGAEAAQGYGKVAGFACAAAVADEVELHSIAVDPACRGRGIGAVLLEALVEWAREAGYRTLHLEVRAGNVPALALYRRFGFAQAGIRRAYYQDNGEDALLLVREIPPGRQDF